MSKSSAATWEGLQCPVKFAELIRRWLSETPEDDRWLAGHSLAPPRG